MDFKLMEITTPGVKATLKEICEVFQNEAIYQLDANTPTELIVIVDSKVNVFATFEPVGFGTYEIYSMNYDDVDFVEVAHLWADTVTKIH